MDFVGVKETLHNLFTVPLFTNKCNTILLMYLKISISFQEVSELKREEILNYSTLNTVMAFCV